MIIDEVHHLLAGSVREQRQLLNQLKFISNELRMPIVALGTSEALYAMQTDPQIASRFEPFSLPKWRESPGFREFVVSFGRLLPLEKPSPLADKAIIQKLMGLSSGLTGKVTTLLTQAAELAIRMRSSVEPMAGRWSLLTAEANSATGRNGEGAKGTRPRRS